MSKALPVNSEIKNRARDMFTEVRCDYTRGYLDRVFDSELIPTPSTLIDNHDEYQSGWDDAEGDITLAAESHWIRY